MSWKNDGVPTLSSEKNSWEACARALDFHGVAPFHKSNIGSILIKI